MIRHLTDKAEIMPLIKTFNLVTSNFFPDSSPVESHVLGTDEVTSGCFDTTNYFQVAMGLLILLQTVIR